VLNYLGNTRTLIVGRLTGQCTHNALHYLRANSISQHLDFISSGTLIKYVVLAKPHCAPQLVNLQHSHARLAVNPLDKPKSI